MSRGNFDPVVAFECLGRRESFRSDAVRESGQAKEREKPCFHIVISDV